MGGLLREWPDNMGGLLREGPYKRGTTAPTTSKATLTGYLKRYSETRANSRHNNFKDTLFRLPFLLLLPVKSVLMAECNYSVHICTVQLKPKSYLQLKTGWSTIYIWDFCVFVLDLLHSE